MISVVLFLCADIFDKISVEENMKYSFKNSDANCVCVWVFFFVLFCFVFNYLF